MKAKEFFQACLDKGLDADELTAAYLTQIRLFPETFDPDQQETTRKQRKGSPRKSKEKQATATSTEKKVPQS